MVIISISQIIPGKIGFLETDKIRDLGPGMSKIIITSMKKNVN